MRSFTPIVAIVALVAAIAVPTAAAGRGHNTDPCVQFNKVTGACKVFKVGAPVTPVAHPITPPGTTPPPVVTPVVPPAGGGISQIPTLNPNLPVKAYCVATVQRGWTFVQANVGSFDEGGDWFALWSTGATVVLDGHTVTLDYLGGKGLRDAILDPVVGLTC